VSGFNCHQSHNRPMPAANVPEKGRKKKIVLCRERERRIDMPRLPGQLVECEDDSGCDGNGQSHAPCNGPC
jgi:hypothetical protein